MVVALVNIITNPIANYIVTTNNIFNIINPGISLVMILEVVLGKALGGIIGDKYGWQKVGVISLLISAPLKDIGYFQRNESSIKKRELLIYISFILLPINTLMVYQYYSNIILANVQL